MAFTSPKVPNSSKCQRSGLRPLLSCIRLNGCKRTIELRVRLRDEENANTLQSLVYTVCSLSNRLCFILAAAGTWPPCARTWLLPLPVPMTAASKCVLMPSQAPYWHGARPNPVRRPHQRHRRLPPTLATLRWSQSQVRYCAQLPLQPP